MPARRHCGGNAADARGSSSPIRVTVSSQGGISESSRASEPRGRCLSRSAAPAVSKSAAACPLAAGGPTQSEGVSLRECTEAVLAVEGRTAHEILGSPDDMKLKSCMTLFELADGPGSVFSSILEKYFEGQRDERSLTILNAPLS